MNVKVALKKFQLDKELDNFTDRAIYNVAVLTREMTKSLHAFPRLTGRLEQAEVQEQITGSNKEYGLMAGVDYAKYVWVKGEKTNWTNPNTEPQWYYSVYRKHEREIVNDAVSRVLKEV